MKAKLTINHFERTPDGKRALLYVATYYYGTLTEARIDAVCRGLRYQEEPRGNLFTSTTTEVNQPSGRGVALP